MSKNLFTPINIGDLELPNRIVMAPTTRGRGGPQYAANDLIAEHYRQRVSSGLIITEGSQVSLQASGWYHTPGIYRETDVEHWTNVVETVHRAGGRIFSQLWHSGRASHSSFRAGIEGFEGGLAKGIGPSAIKRKTESNKQRYTPGGIEVEVETPREMTIKDIDDAVIEFIEASKNAKEAGFDGIEIHAANGYLIDTFLQSSSNARTDEYGGSFENRFRFLKRILSGIGQVWESNQIAVRLGPNTTFNGMGASDNFDAFMYYIKQLKEFNLAYLHVIIGETNLAAPHHSLGKLVTLRDVRDNYEGIIMANEGFNKESATKAIESGTADLVSFSRLFISNPDLVEKFKSDSQLNEIDYTTVFSSLNSHPKVKGYNDYPTLFC